MNKGPVYLGRASWFLLRTILIVLLCAGVFYFAFATAMNYGSIYVISTEGIELRADVILGAAQEDELSSYFTEQWLQSDGMLTQSPYENYKVTAYNYSLRLEKIRVWAWSKTGAVTVTERVTGLTGTATDGALGADGKAAEAPAWTDCRYELILEKGEGGVWKINEIRLLEELPKPTPAPTEEPSASPEQPDAQTPAEPTPEAAPTPPGA